MRNDLGQVFISYAREDRDRVAQIARALEERGLSVWWDPDIPPGSTFDDEVERALEAASAVVVIWSSASIGSRWVRTEAAEGLDRGILVPVLLDPVRPPLAFRRIQCVDLTDQEEVAGTTGLGVLIDVLEQTERSVEAPVDPAPSRPPGGLIDARVWSTPLKVVVGVGLALLFAAWAMPGVKRTPLMIARSDGLSLIATRQDGSTYLTGTWLLAPALATATVGASRLWRRVSDTTTGATLGTGIASLLLVGTWLVWSRGEVTLARPLTFLGCVALGVSAVMCLREARGTGLLDTERIGWPAELWGILAITVVSALVYVAVPFSEAFDGEPQRFAAFAPWSLRQPGDYWFEAVVALGLWTLVPVALIHWTPPRVAGLAIGVIFIATAWLRAAELVVHNANGLYPFGDSEPPAEVAVLVSQVGMWGLAGMLGLTLRWRSLPRAGSAS